MQNDFKTILLFILLVSISLVSISGHSQSVVVNYEEKRIISESRLAEMPPFMREEAQKSNSYVLTYSNGISLYKNSERNKNSDSSVTNTKEVVNDTLGIVDVQTTNYRITRTNIEKYYYKDLSRNLMLFEFVNANKKFYGKDDLVEWNWVLTGETKKIGSYICSKATSNAYNLSFTAWFTSDLPVSAGPEKFDGLPGLIVHIATPYFEWSATSITPITTNISIEEPIITAKTQTMSEIYSFVDKEVAKLRPSTITTQEGGSTTTTKRVILGK